MKKDYDTFLIYGYTALITAIITWVIVHFTGRGEAMFTWFAMFIPYFINTFFCKNPKPEGQPISTACWEIYGKSSEACSYSR